MRRLIPLTLSILLVVSVAATATASDHTEEGDVPEAEFRKAELIADYVAGPDGDTEAATEEILELRQGEPSIGWGAMFKLTQLAKAKDIPLSELLAELDSAEGWGFGRLFKDLSDEERERLDGTPKNFGQLKKQDKWGEDGKPGKGPKK